jgi:hypothetical protein
MSASLFLLQESRLESSSVRQRGDVKYRVPLCAESDVFGFSRCLQRGVGFRRAKISFTR